MREIIIDGKAVGSGHPVFVIAEIGFNHGGDMGLAVKMIEAAAKAGVDAVKFQSFHASGLVLENTEHFKIIKGGELSREDHRLLKSAADAEGVTFLSTPFDIGSVDMLEEIHVPAYKVASMDLTNLPLLRHISGTGKPMIISTGMADEREILKALDAVCNEVNGRTVLLHCVSKYPSPPEDANIRAILRLQEMFACPVGYSDHTLGNASALAAVALGACLVEKHFTTDKSLPGPDHKISADPGEMARLVGDIRIIEKSLGGPESVSMRSDRENARSFRRGLYAGVDIPAGTVISDEMLKCVRPEAEILPKDVEKVVGRVAKTDIKKDQAVSWGDL